VDVLNTPSSEHPKITATNVIKFFKKNILSKFGIPQSVITDDGTQFAEKRMRELLEELNIKQHFTSVKHPQTNEQAKSTNNVILRGLKRRLEKAKGNRPEELPHILWACRTTPHSTTEETSFCITFGMEAMVPVEVKELS
jgi:transposase InsO family protein